MALKRFFALLLLGCFAGPAAWAQAPVVIEGEAPIEPAAQSEPAGMADARPAAPARQSGMAQGGMPRDLWLDTTYLAATPLIQQAAVAILEGSMREAPLKQLALRLALTDAAPPMGGGEDGKMFYESRALLAAAAGDPADALVFAKRSPGAISEKGAQRIAAILLMQGDFDGACADPHLSVLNEAFWQKLSVICALREENGAAKAQLGIDAMREAGETDTLFLELAEAASGGKKSVTGKPSSVPALHAALLAVGHVPPNPSMLKLLAQNPYPLLLQLDAPPEWRMQAALQLAANRAVSPEILSDLVMHLPLKADVLKKLRADTAVLSNEKLVAPALRIPYALQAARASSGTTAKAKLIAALIDLLPAQHLAGGMGGILLAETPAPSAGAGLYASSIARLALLANDESAREWYRLASTPVALAPLAAAKGFDSNPAETLIAYAAKADVLIERRVNALALLQALGIDPGAKALAAIAAQSGTLPVPARDAALEAALEANHKGEALLRALLLSPSNAISVQLTRIQALRALGFENEALKLALPRL